MVLGFLFLPLLPLSHELRLSRRVHLPAVLVLLPALHSLAKVIGRTGDVPILKDFQPHLRIIPGPGDVTFLCVKAAGRLEKEGRLETIQGLLLRDKIFSAVSFHLAPILKFLVGQVRAAGIEDAFVHLACALARQVVVGLGGGVGPAHGPGHPVRPVPHLDPGAKTRVQVTDYEHAEKP